MKNTPNDKKAQFKRLLHLYGTLCVEAYLEPVSNTELRQMEEKLENLAFGVKNE